MILMPDIFGDPETQKSTCLAGGSEDSAVTQELLPRKPWGARTEVH